MVIRVGKHSGFCFGVRSAVDSAFSVAEKHGPCVSLGPLAHNQQVLEKLAQAGVSAVDDLNQATHGPVVIRSHGVGPEVLAACQARGLEVMDLTCPCVKRVHTIAGEAACPVIIVGRADHPEVVGTAGWCKGPVYVVETPEEVAALPPMEEARVVAQTTMPTYAWEQVVDRLKAKIPVLDVRNTICGATRERQAEAAELAAWADVMLVVGSRASANTQKLYDTCAKLCPRTYFVETAADLPEGKIGQRDQIGITAGASTPDWSIKEVVTRMNDMEHRDQQEAENTAEQNFMADVEATLVTIRPGQTITGTVVQITDDEVCVNIGYKSDGLVKKSDLTSQDVKVGDEIDVEVVKVNDGEGNVILSQRNVVNRKNWDALMEKHDAGENVEGVGKEAVKGGLIANVMGVRAFIPASQLSQRYVEKIEDFVGKTMMLKIIEVDKAKKRIVCSRKAVMAEEASVKKKDAWSKLTEGEVVTGVVRRLTDFGAFVDGGGVDGLVHVTDLSWGRVKHPSEIVSPNQEIQVKILSLDPERERIQLGYKQTQPRPWDIAEEKYPMGAIVEGKVVRITTFGAFVELEPGLDGLVHISQCALTRIAKVEDAVQVGQIVRVKVLGVDKDAKRISLSIRAALEEEAFNYSDDIPGDDFSFGDALGEEMGEMPVNDEAPMDAEVPADDAQAPEEA